MKFILSLCLAYIMGSIPSGVWLGKFTKGIDIREHGSKNTGATNAYRVLGPKLGITVMVLDILKGFIPVLIAGSLGVEGFAQVVVGIMCIVGHSLSLFLNFKGGKGVATSLGVFLVLAPIPVLLSVLAFVGVVFATRYVSLGSIIAAGLIPITTWAIYGSERIDLLIAVLLVAGFVIYKHKANIKRLLNGTENKFKSK